MYQTMLELTLDRGEIEMHGECRRQLEAVMRSLGRRLRELDRTPDGETELAVEVPYRSGGHEALDRQPAGNASRHVLDTSDLVLGEEVVEPLSVYVECKRCNRNVIDAHANFS